LSSTVRGGVGEGDDAIAVLNVSQRSG